MAAKRRKSRKRPNLLTTKNTKVLSGRETLLRAYLSSVTLAKGDRRLVRLIRVKTYVFFVANPGLD